jgi:indolepyruvate ferredoxin oxidoreductase beta subunit
MAGVERPVCVLMAALGGQGGGVLADWLVAAARIDGLQAQATSIPGVAQRTGATTYYFEVYPQRDLAARPVFSIFPASGAIDLMVSFEPMEAARALSSGYISKDTTVITARERIYATFEKIRPGDGITPLEPVFKALESLAGTLNIVEMSKAARRAKCHPNAVMFGAMVASGVLPFLQTSCRIAITNTAKAVEENLAGFEAGMALASLLPENFAPPAPVYETPAPHYEAALAALPEQVRKIAGHGVSHLLDYQDDVYARFYLKRLGQVIAVDSQQNNYQLSGRVARQLASWMAFEDIIRVAQLKTRPGRFARIRKELSVSADTPIAVHDYLKPGRQEFFGMLPGKRAARLARKPGGGVPLKIKTSSPFGFALMKLLASMRRWRPKSARYAREQELISRWLDLTVTTANKDYQLACSIAELAVWARGYGETRQRGFEQLETVLQSHNGAPAEFADIVAASLACASAIP